jgi:methionyl-tRNA synthetase
VLDRPAMPSRFYVTTPIYYVNDVPHLGHAYTTVAADALRRYHLLRGHEARMLTGTDEHGLKIERAAAEAGKTPQAFVDDVSARFREAWPILSVEPDDFIRTTEPRHEARVQELWRRVAANGDLYKGSYEDWYCVGCESFKTEKELLPGNICALHLKPVEKVQEETYFFRLAKFEQRLLALYRDRPDFIQPESRRNEVVSFVEGGLKDLSVSRTSFRWGVPVPDDPAHVMYVWFDALANYWTALGGDTDPRQRFWPGKGKDARAVHLVGKDILRFHAVYWPAFLLAAGFTEDELPSQVFAHGFLTIDGQKMSKALRNGVDPLRLARELGPDAVRYQLLRAIAFGQDGDFDHKELFARYHADLANTLGNLLQRTLGLTTKLTDGKPPRLAHDALDTALLSDEVRELEQLAAQRWDSLEIHRALESTWAIAALANQYVDHAAPWAAAKRGDTARVEVILATLLEVLGRLSVMVSPVLPNKSGEMRAQLGLAPLLPAIGQDLWPAPGKGHRGEALQAAKPLFPTFDKDEERAMLERLVPKPDPATTAVATIANAPSAAIATAGAPPRADGAASSITYEQFIAVDLRVGVVRECERVPKKDKLLRLRVDLGEQELRVIVAGLAQTFTPEALVDRRVVVVANLAPRDFGKGLVSHGMLLATGPSDALALASAPDGVAPGSRLK